MSKGSFLIVEDEFVVAENLRREIVSMEYEVAGMASSGREAIELARLKKPDLVLMDIKLIGEMDGIETAIQLRQNWDIPVLFLTAFSDDNILERAKLAEPLGYLVKPYEKKGLRASVEMALYKARTERILKESESRFRSMFENSPVAYLALDESICCLDFNSEFCRLLGYDREEMIGKNLIGFCPHGMQHLYLEHFAIVKKDGRHQTELNMVCKDNTVLTVLLECRVQYHVDGRFLRTHCILHNITERKRAEEEQMRLSQRLQQIQKIESLSRMAGAIAHHFNNQLQAVIGNRELAMYDPSMTPNNMKFLTEATKAANKAAEVSSLMLTCIGQTSGRKDLLDLPEICTRILPMIQTAIPKNVILKTDFTSPAPAVMANAKQIQQVVINLVTNAYEAIGQCQGSIHLKVRTVSLSDIPAARRYPIDWETDNIPYVCLEVIDNGCGITDTDIDKIFEPFFTSKFIGRGLGLTVVLGIVQSHDGAVTVESEPGGGSVFRVFLPASPAVAEKISLHPEKTIQTPEPEGSGTVLLIEDETQICDIAKAMLTHLGFTVLGAGDGMEAVEIFRQHHEEITCVLSDLTMPRMNGWDTLDALRKLSPDIPVILSSGFDEDQVMAGDHAERPNAFIGKPYRLMELGKVIRRVLADKDERK